MRVAVYGAVLMITLGSVLLGLDWLSAPMSPMVDTDAGLHAAVPPPVAAPSTNISAPIAPTAPVVPKANIGAPIVSPRLIAPTSQNVPAQAGAAAEVAPPVPIVAPAPELQQPSCNVEACTAAYRSFRASDCTYLPTGGPRKLCTKQSFGTAR
jgi:hypothetical protein